MIKYRLWEHGQSVETNSVPENTPIVGVNGFQFITNEAHYCAAGFNLEELPESERKKPAHFNLPFAEIINYAPN
jgi:hypothetical protein